MPQEGLNVFYRFFRDRISWFEADAVCQFHHANLVTVDNSFQFDATRDLLRELDVNDIVWIGLMRPQSSDRFMWSNSRPLVTNTGYWAESLPLMDAPLCAVIDPIRDYRWHALRCGGPETASFLCEMPVPSWADACILKDMPNLTMQYMADTASIELIRNCQEEGLLRTACKGKQDREQALQSLICPRERLEAQRINDITNSHFKSMQIINSIPTDNNENNNIELLPIDGNYGSINTNPYVDQVQTEQNTVQKLIEQFNVDELMQADEQPSQMETINNFYKLQGPISNPVKKSGKKLTEFTKKDLTKQQLLENEKKEEILKMEEMMLGDQPMSAQRGEPEIAEHILEDVVSNEIMEHLPHSKKVLTLPTAQTLHTIELMKEKLHKDDEKQNEKLLKLKFERKIIASRSTAATTTANTATTTTSAAATASLITTTDINLNTDKSSTTVNNLTTPKPFTQMHSTTIAIPSIAAAAATISHPIHPQQPHSNVFTESPPRLPHAKETADNSHFIPPMLLVKSHYVPTSKHVGHGEHRTLEYHTEPVEKVQQTASPGIIIEMEGTTLKSLDDTAKLIVSEKYREIEESTIKAVTEQETNRNKPNNNSNSIRIDYSTTKQPLATTDETKLYTTLQTTVINPTTQKIQTISRNVAVVEQQNDDTNTMATDVIAIQDQQKKGERKMEVETTKSALTTEKMHDLVAENVTNIEEAQAKKEQKEEEKQEDGDEKKKPEMAKEKRVKTTMLALNSKQKPDQKEQALITTKTISYTQTIEHAHEMTDRATTEKPKVAIYAAETQNIQTEISVQNVEEKEENRKQKSEQEQEQEQQEEQDQEEQEVKQKENDKQQKETIVKTMEHTTFPTKMTTTANNKEPITLNIEIAKVNEKPEDNIHQPTTTATTTTSTTTSTTINNTTTNVAPNTSITTHSTQPADVNVTQTTRNFLKVTTEEPYKPNRRRSLTKPETMSYIKKILG
uniref:C-type lectin domain-containing protein n=1 Tax=Glossina pallidipes TaxID=7398 RepID=A0A1A9ZMC7_GLOPL